MDAQPSSLQETRFSNAKRDRPWVINASNAALGWSRRYVDLSAQSIVDKALKGRRHLDPELLGFRAELDLLCEALQSEANLNFVGRVAARGDMVRLVQTHLDIKRALNDQPVNDVELMPPIFILGAARTGTSFLQGLLTADPQSRGLLYYESFNPVLPSGRDLRDAELGKTLKLAKWLSPHYDSIHALESNIAEECVAMFMNAFRTLQFDIQYRVPSYVKGVYGTDPLPAYRLYRDQLRMVQRSRREGSRWVLKDPTHLFAVETIVSLFPNARFVHTHRDPVETVGSMCSLYAHSRAFFTDDITPQDLGQELLNGYWPVGLTDLVELRRRRPDIPIVDVRYADLVRDPMSVVRATYNALELDLSPDAVAAMDAYIAAHPQAPNRVHRYSPDQYGFSVDAVGQRFSAYRQAYDL